MIESSQVFRYLCIGLNNLQLYIDVHINTKLKLFVTFYSGSGENIHKDTIKKENRRNNKYHIYT